VGTDELPGRDGLGELIGLEYEEVGEDAVTARVPVTERILMPYGLVHGGVYSAVAESVCSRATFEAVKDGGKLAFGQSNSATFLRPISEGHVNAAAHARHRGRTSWVWQVEITDDEQRLCALVTVAVAVRDAPVHP
jgi:1,4-dihydroxy-2-naphthoyl-CoA hydrolase